jgi:hypothetical protein
MKFKELDSEQNIVGRMAAAVEEKKNSFVQTPVPVKAYRAPGDPSYTNINSKNEQPGSTD